MALDRIHKVFTNLATLESTALFSGDGIILSVNARWIGYTKSESERSYILGGIRIGFLDSESYRPLREDETTRILVPYGNAFYYTNPYASTIYSATLFAGDSPFKISKPVSRLTAQFNGGLNFEAISDDVANPHSIDLDVEVYLFD